MYVRKCGNRLNELMEHHTYDTVILVNETRQECVSCTVDGQAICYWAVLFNGIASLNLWSSNAVCVPISGKNGVIASKTKTESVIESVI